HDNWVGVTREGAPIPNTKFGLLLGYITHDNIIGPNNMIAYNPVGIDITSAAYRNTITQNSIFANGRAGLGIAGAAGTQGGIITPTLSGATPAQVSGTACPNCTVEVFIADSLGQGQTYLTTGTAAGDGSFTIALPATTTIQAYHTWLTATGTDGLG